MSLGSSERPRGQRLHLSPPRPIPPVEFYVDFETENSVNDDFAKIPEQNGQNLIFLIGCGHMRADEWVFRCFTVDRLNEESEAVMIDEWRCRCHQRKSRLLLE